MKTKYAWLSAILLILALFACSAFFRFTDAKVLESEKKALYVEIKSVGVWHQYKVDGQTVVLVYGENND